MTAGGQGSSSGVQWAPGGSLFFPLKMKTSCHRQGIGERGRDSRWLSIPLLQEAFQVHQKGGTPLQTPSPGWAATCAGLGPCILAAHHPRASPSAHLTWSTLSSLSWTQHGWGSAVCINTPVGTFANFKGLCTNNVSPG